MKKILSIVLMTILFSSSISVVKADVINPDYLTKKCKVGEKQVVCQYKSEKPFGPVTETNCDKYENNPDYYLLTSTGSSFGGSMKYCLKTKQERSLDQAVPETYPDNFISNTLIIGGIVVIALVFLYYLKTRNV